MAHSLGYNIINYSKHNKWNIKTNFLKDSDSEGNIVKGRSPRDSLMVFELRADMSQVVTYTTGLQLHFLFTAWLELVGTQVGDEYLYNNPFSSVIYLNNPYTDHAKICVRRNELFESVVLYCTALYTVFYNLMNFLF